MMHNPYPGKFIAFEGLDGSGQTTQSARLASRLKEDGKEAFLTKEPTQDSEAGKRIRNVLDKREVLLARELQWLFAQDRKEHLEKTIIPALQKGQWVLCDRYVFSSLAFGVAAGAKLEELIAFNSEFLLPDITFLLKTRPEVCMQRIVKRGNPITLFEEERKMQKIWEVYETLPSRFPSICIIDAEQSIGKVAHDIWQIIFQQLV